MKISTIHNMVGKFMTLMMAATTLVACQDFNPAATRQDPEGTIPLKMRNADNGKTYLAGNIYIDAGNNFSGGEFACLGYVSGLNKITKIPETGWADKVAVLPGNGYVAIDSYSWSGSYYGIYVVDYIEGVSGGIIGAEVKYYEIPVSEKAFLGGK